MKTRIRAFTLIEVLAALAIVALSAIVLGAAYVNVLLGYEHAEEATRVDADVQFAREILFREPDREQAEEGDSFENAAGREVRWRATIEPTDIADLFDVQFEVIVAGDQTETERVVQERFRMLRPTWSEDNERELRREESRNRIEEYLRGREARR